MKKQDIIRKVFTRLTVIEKLPDFNKSTYKCLCLCGNYTKVARSNLISGHTKSCGCLAKETKEAAFKDITGQVFSRLTAIKPKGIKRKAKLWECKCSCGNTTLVTQGELKSGGIQSCGCLRVDSRKKHGLSRHRLNTIRNNMRQRCTNPKNNKYPIYGGRGINICVEWLQNPKEFFNWALTNGYEDTLSIDRKDNDKGYSPENCRWVNASIQNRNKRKDPTTTSKYKNISLTEAGTWLVQMRVEGKRHHLGRFKTEEAAYNAKQLFIKCNNIHS